MENVDVGIVRVANADRASVTVTMVSLLQILLCGQASSSVVPTRGRRSLYTPRS